MAQLRVPGPTPCPPEVLKAGAWQMINHRGSEFHEMITQVTEDMKKVFQTKNDVLLLTGSGTGGLESAVVNMFSPGDKVLSVSIGVFGDRWATIAKTFGVDVVSLKAEWGKAADPDALKKALKDNPGVKAVFITHNETSTGVTNDLKSLAKVVKDAGKLLVEVSLWVINTALTPGLSLMAFFTASGSAALPHSTLRLTTSTPNVLAIFAHLSPNTPMLTESTLSPGENRFTTADSRPPVPEPVSKRTSFLVWKTFFMSSVTCVIISWNSLPR